MFTKFLTSQTFIFTALNLKTFNDRNRFDIICGVCYSTVTNLIFLYPVFIRFSKIYSLLPKSSLWVTTWCILRIYVILISSKAVATAFIGRQHLVSNSRSISNKANFCHWVNRTISNEWLPLLAKSFTWVLLDGVYFITLATDLD